MSDDCCNRNALMVYLPTQSPTGLLWREGRGQAPAPDRRAVGNHKGETFHTCCMELGIPFLSGCPSQAAPCLTLYWHSLGTDRTAAPSRAKLWVHWEPSDKVFGDVLTPFPNVVHHQAQDSRNTTGGKDDLGLLDLALVPRATSLKQWPEAH